MNTEFLGNLFELIKQSKDENVLFDKFLNLEKNCKDKSTLEVAQKIVNMAISNLKERKSLLKSIKYYQTMKNIAKIVETQYELKYILPIIGEMIDGLIEDHLVYIFLKNAHKKEYKLAWPTRCISGEIQNNLLKITSKGKPVIDDKTGVFPLMCDEKVLGAIVAHNHFEKLNKQEELMLLEISKQVSLTISTAMKNGKILKDATLDALTGINNRRQFEIRLKQEIATAKRQNSSLCAIMMDIDHFKSVNDTYGHAVGDLVLKNVSKIIQKEIREYDIASRYGGEEFSIILPYTEKEEAAKVAQRLRAAVEKKKIDISDFNIEGVDEISVTISLGVNEFDRAEEDPSVLYKNADKALYTAKETGRNKVVIYKGE